MLYWSVAVVSDVFFVGGVCGLFFYFFFWEYCFVVQCSHSPGKLEFYVRPEIFCMISQFMLVLTL